MRRLSSAVGLVGASARYQMRMVRAHPLFLIGGVLQPAVLLIIMFLAYGRPTGERAAAIASAVMLMAYWGSTVWQGANALRRERFYGTLVGVMRGVRDPFLVVLGMSLGASLAPALLTAVTVLVMLVLLGASVVVAAPAWFAVGIAAAVLSGTALGTVLSSLFLLTRHGNQLSSALLYPVFLLAGLLIPVEFFPVAVRWVSWFISLRWAQQFLVSAAHGHPDFAALGLVVALTLAYAVAGMVAFRRIDHLVRRRGTLELG